MLIAPLINQDSINTAKLVVLSLYPFYKKGDETGKERNIAKNDTKLTGYREEKVQMKINIKNLLRAAITDLVGE